MPGTVAGEARAARHALDPGIPAADLHGMNAVRSTSVADRRLNALLVGSVAALTLVIALGGTLADLLYDATPYDAAVFATVAGVLLLVGAAASYFPARRALSVDPLLALRQ